MRPLVATETLENGLRSSLTLPTMRPFMTNVASTTPFPTLRTSSPPLDPPRVVGPQDVFDQTYELLLSLPASPTQPMRGRGAGSGVEVDQRRASLFHIREGKVTRLALYWDPDRALADLGLEE